MLGHEGLGPELAFEERIEAFEVADGHPHRHELAPGIC